MWHHLTALALYGKEEKEKASGGSGLSGIGSGFGRVRDVPGKLRVPWGDPLEFVVPDMGNEWYEFPGFAIYPIRALLPPINVARYVGEWFCMEVMTVSDFVMRLKGFGSWL